MNKSLFSVFGCLLVAHSFAAQRDALEMLRQSMANHCSIPAKLIQSQATGSELDQKVVSKVEMDGKGNWRRTVLQPLRLQGSVTMSDGKDIMMLSPTEKVVMKQAAVAPMKADARVALISKNYTVRMTGSVRIAGRDAVIITCKPKVDGVSTRRVYLDSENAYMLRSEIIDDKGQISTVLDTMAAVFPSRNSRVNVSLEIPDDYRVIRINEFERLGSVSAAAPSVKFQPVVPSQLPFGFAVESIDLIRRGQNSVLAVRLTDGFVSVTGYQWDSESNPRFSGTSNATNVVENKGVRFRFVGDLPTALLTQLIETFIKVTALSGTGNFGIDPERSVPIEPSTIEADTLKK